MKRLSNDLWGGRISSDARIDKEKFIFHDGIWYNGTWTHGNWIDGTWLNGIWYTGDWQGGVWHNGTWHNGTWHSGYWYKGFWLNGVWNTGEKFIFKHDCWKHIDISPKSFLKPKLTLSLNYAKYN